MHRNSPSTNVFSMHWAALSLREASEALGWIDRVMMHRIHQVLAYLAARVLAPQLG